MDEQTVRAIIQRAKEETKEELRKEFSEQIADLQDTVQKQQGQIDAVTAFYAKMADPRLTYFSTDEPSSAGSKAIQDPIMIMHRRNQKSIALQHTQCMACGGDGSNSVHGLTCAHIVPNTGKLSDYTCWGTSSTIANYATDIDPYSSANLLVLCGTKGEQGTCHDAYDKHQISMYYNEATNDYIWWVRRPDYVNHMGADIHDKHVGIADPKYRRLLAWRTLAAMQVLGPTRLQTVTEKINLVDKIQQSEAGEML